MTPVALAPDVCDLGERARRDPAGAGEHVNGQLRGPLHDVTNELIASDRAPAGEVMVAKATVEQLIAAEATEGDALAEALGALARTLPAIPVGADVAA